MVICSCNNSSDKSTSLKTMNEVKEKAKSLLLVYETENNIEELNKVLNDLDQLLASGIRDKEIYQIKGRILRIKKDYQEFAKMMEESTLYFPENPQSFFGAGLAFEKVGMKDEAMHFYKKSIDVYDILIKEYPSLSNYVNRSMSICFFHSKEEGIKSFEKIKTTGLFESEDVDVYRAMFYRFKREQYIEDAFRN